MCFFPCVGSESANAPGVQGEMLGAVSTVGLSQAPGWALNREPSLELGTRWQCQRPYLSPSLNWETNASQRCAAYFG